MANNGEVGHSFVYGYNAKGSNFESANGTLWSYSSVLAKKHNGMIIIDNHIANYSNTSQKHASHLNRAIGWGTTAREGVITLYRADINQITHSQKNWSMPEVIKEIEGAVEDIKEMLVKQSRARTRSYFTEIERRIANTFRLIDTFGIDKRNKHYKEFVKDFSDIEALKEGYKDIIAEHAKKVEKKRKAQIAKKYKARLEKLQKFTGADLKGYTKTEIVNYDFLFVDDAFLKLKTSANVAVDLIEAKLLWKALKRGYPIIGKKIGYYTIIKHDKKAVKIGCHNILIKELERVLDEK